MTNVVNIRDYFPNMVEPQESHRQEPKSVFGLSVNEVRAIFGGDLERYGQALAAELKENQNGD